MFLVAGICVFLQRQQASPGAQAKAVGDCRSTAYFSALQIMKTVAFRVYFAALLVLALFPPLYLSTSGNQALILGVPLPIAYWIGIPLLAALGISALYLVECRSNDPSEEELAK